MIQYVCVIWTCKAAAVYKVYSIAARMLADFQESVGLTNNIWEKETAKTPKMQIYGRKESFLFIFFLLER